MASVSMRWWGGIVALDRNETCSLIWGGLPAAGATAALPGPFNVIVPSVIIAHSVWINSQAGTEGADLHISWAGVLHWVVSRGDKQMCAG